MNADGSNQTRITNNSSADDSPYWGYPNYHSPATMNITQAAQLGLIGGYIYKWNNWNQSYDAPILVSSAQIISPYDTYWIEVFQDVNLISKYPAVLQYPFGKPPKFPGLLEGGTEELPPAVSDMWYSFSLPVNSEITDHDVKSNFIAWSQGYLTESNFDDKWMVFKYKYNQAGEPKMLYYGETGFNNYIAPGQGYFFQHLLETPFKFLCPYTDEALTTDWKLKAPFEDPDHMGYSLHHAGNPFWCNLILNRDIYVEIPVDNSLPLAKTVAGIPLDSIQTWFVGMKLESADHSLKDLYNRAGAATDFSGNTRGLCALDLVKPGKSVRLILKDPSNASQGGLAYDIRPADLNEYSWIIELTTTENNINTVFSIDDFQNVPAGYAISLTDTKTGELYPLDSPRSFNVTLTSGKKQTYILTATQKPVSVADTKKPVAFGITAVTPNPFNPTTTIHYSLLKEGNVSINVYNVSGQVVCTLAESYKTAGNHSLVWNAAGAASGIYFVRILSNSLTDSRKITLVK